MVTSDNPCLIIGIRIRCLTRFSWAKTQSIINPHDGHCLLFLVIVLRPFSCPAIVFGMYHNNTLMLSPRCISGSATWYSIGKTLTLQHSTRNFRAGQISKVHGVAAQGQDSR